MHNFHNGATAALNEVGISPDDVHFLNLFQGVFVVRSQYFINFIVLDHCLAVRTCNWLVAVVAVEDEFLKAEGVDHVEALSGLDTGNNSLLFVSLSDAVLAETTHFEITDLFRLHNQLVNHGYILLEDLAWFLDFTKSAHLELLILSTKIRIHIGFSFRLLLAWLDLFDALHLSILAGSPLDQVLPSFQLRDTRLGFIEEHLHNVLEIRKTLQRLVPHLVILKSLK